MKLLQPKFWYNGNIIGKFLYPLSLIYFIFSNILRLFKTEKKIDIPIICVGNVVIGGSGKTQTCIALRKLLSPEFKNLFTLTKGYRGKQKNCYLVKKYDSFKKVGDDALIHCLHGPVCVCKNRVEGASFCLKEGAELIILDDGLQSKHIRKDLNFLIVDGKQRLGNKKLFPAGPLREPLNHCFKKCHAIILIDYQKEDFQKEHDSSIPIFLARKKILINKIKKNIFAFCGIGFPGNFFNSLTDRGFNLVHSQIFGDHHNYRKYEIERILKIAKSKHLDVVTTEKDYVRLEEEYKKIIKYTKVEIQFDNKDQLLSFILKTIN